MGLAGYARYIQLPDVGRDFHLRIGRPVPVAAPFYGQVLQPGCYETFAELDLGGVDEVLRSNRAMIVVLDVDHCPF